ncbi:MAG: ABC transporter permease [Planctomycetaceae bacterium]|nr:ABC transporter permease [Planctomycetaceae bacterium]
MLKTLVLARREMAAYFFSPVAYVIGALFLAGSAAVFFFGLSPLGIPIFEPVLASGSTASLRPLFEAMAAIMVFAAPLLTMRLMSEEFRSGTIETLMTAPVTDVQVVLGKFLGVMGFYAALLASTTVLLAVMAAYSKPDIGVAISGYIGMLLLGAAFLAVGLFASTLTEYQIVAVIVGVAMLSVFALLMQFLMTHLGEPWNLIAGRLSALDYFRSFARGTIDTRALAFFLTTAALFLFLSIKTLESRRWR